MGWKIDCISMGSFGLDGGAMFGIIPKPLWQRTNPDDDKNRITLQSNCMLLRQGERCVIVEVGNSFDFSDKDRSIYAIGGVTPQPTWQQALKPFDLTPEQITDVICTHLHFDHAGGLSFLNSDGKRQLSFPNATHYIQKRQLEWAKAPSEKDAGSFRSEGIYPFIEDHAKCVFLEGDGELFEGVRVTTVDGHTPAQQLVHVQQQEQNWVFVADLIPTTSHLHLPYIMAYDVEPLKTLKEKQDFLKQAVDEAWTLWFYHDPKTIAAKVTFDGRRFQLGEVVLPG